MTLSSRFVAAAGIAAAIAFASPAQAQFWNPFNRQPAQPAPVQPLPAPPAAVPPGGVLAPPAGVPGAPVGVSPAGISAPTDAALRIDRVEAQMRGLTGQVEELTYRLRLAEEEIRRLGGTVPELSGDAVAAIPAPAAPLPPTPPPAPVAAAPSNAGVAPGFGEPPRVLGAIAAAPSPANPNSPMDLGAAIRGVLPPDGQQTAALAVSGDPRRDYDAAYDLVVSGDYDLAEIGFRAFLTRYPQDQMAPDAQFWVGETLFTRGRFREAADEFLTGYNAYPNSPKTPETLLKLGQSLAALGEKQTACETYAAALRQFPTAPNALRQQVQAEQARGSC